VGNLIKAAASVPEHIDDRKDRELDPYPRRESSMPTESTKNGMSSVTTSTIVFLDCQPCSPRPGL